MRYSRPRCPIAGMVSLPAWIRPSPWAPITNPPMTRPIRPGSPSRDTRIGPKRITANSTKNSNAGPDAPCAVATRVTSLLLGPDQRHVLFGLAEPARGELVDRAVGLQPVNRRVHDLVVRGAVGQRRGESPVPVHLPQHV